MKYHCSNAEGMFIRTAFGKTLTEALKKAGVDKDTESRHVFLMKAEGDNLYRINRNGGKRRYND